MKTSASDIVGIAPDTLNTLKEIANAINNDPNFFQSINTQINLKRGIATGYDKKYIDNQFSNYYTLVKKLIRY